MNKPRSGKVALAAATFITTAVLAVAPVHADALFDGIAALPGNVEDVRVGGTWEKDGHSGVYRILVARKGGDVITARMFVQWVAYQDDGDSVVQSTLEVRELGDLAVDVVDFTSESDADGLSVFIQTLDPNGSADENYELFVHGPDDYRFGPASN
mgnify:CR=1 FL=1